MSWTMRLTLLPFGPVTNLCPIVAVEEGQAAHSLRRRTSIHPHSPRPQLGMLVTWHSQHGDSPVEHRLPEHNCVPVRINDDQVLGLLPEANPCIGQ